jgi:hypothetical protein
VNHEEATPYKLARRMKLRSIQALLATYEPEPRGQPLQIDTAVESGSSAKRMMREPPMSARQHVREVATAMANVRLQPQQQGKQQEYHDQRRGRNGQSSPRDDGGAIAAQGGRSGGSYIPSWPSPHTLSRSHSHALLQAYHAPQEQHHAAAAYYHTNDTATFAEQQQPQDEALLHPSHHHSQPQTSLFVENPHHYHSQVAPPDPHHPHPHAADATAEWDIRYTVDGHAYYVNQRTGISQWECPPDLHDDAAAGASSLVIDTQDSTMGQKYDYPSSYEHFTYHDDDHQYQYLQHRHSNSSTSDRSGGGDYVDGPSHPAQPSGYPAAIAPVSAQYIRAQLGALRQQHQSQQWQASSPHPDRREAHSCLNSSSSSSPSVGQSVVSPTSSPKAGSFKTSFGERRGFTTGMRLSIETVPSQRNDASRGVQDQMSRRASSDHPNSAISSLSSFTSSSANPVPHHHHHADDGSMFQRSRSRSPKGKSKTVKILDVKRSNNIIMTLSDFEFHSDFHSLVLAIINMDERVLTLEKLRCLKHLFPTDDEKETLLHVAGHDKAVEYGKAEKFMLACLEVDDIHARADCFLYKLKFHKSMAVLKTRIALISRVSQSILENPGLCQLLEHILEAKKQEVPWDDDTCRHEIHAWVTAGHLSQVHRASLRALCDTSDLTCLSRSELQENLDVLTQGCRACQAIWSHAKKKEKEKSSATKNDTRLQMSPEAMSELEKFIKSCVGELNSVNEEFRESKTHENRLVTEFGIFLEQFHSLEIFQAAKQLFALDESWDVREPLAGPTDQQDVWL